MIDQAVEIADMTEETPKEGWKPVKSMAFGTFRDNHATLEIYEETGLKDATARVLWGYIKVQGKTFKFPEQLSENLLEEQAESGRSLFVMQRNFPETGSRFYALGGAELMANGPGRIAYAVYDATDDRWKAFEQWGTPAFVDLDGDGNKEFLIVFPGLHNQLPDIKLLSWWEQKNLLTTANVRDAFPVGEHVYAGIDAGKQAITVGYMDEADGAAKAYRLKDHMLIRFPQ